MNHFIYQGPLNSKEHFNIIVERQEFKDILEHIETSDSYVILRNPRQTGKTTLIFQIQQALQENYGYSVVYLNLQGYNELENKKFYQTICKKIYAALSDVMDENTEDARQLTIIKPENVIDQFDFSDCLIWISACTSKKAKKLVIIFDEIGGVPEGIYLAFFSFLRNFFTEGRQDSEKSRWYQRVSFIFVGALDMLRLEDDPNSPLSNVCTIFSLQDFSQKQGIDLLKRNGEVIDLPVEVLEIIAEIIYEWCSGHPYLTLRLYSLIEEKKDTIKDGVKWIQEEKGGQSLKEIIHQISQDLEQVIECLIKKYFLYGNDENLDHIHRQLDKNPEYWKEVYKILGEKPKTVRHKEELLTIGIIKQIESENDNEYYLTIRNKLYNEWLKELCKSSSKAEVHENEN